MHADYLFYLLSIAVGSLSSSKEEHCSGDHIPLSFSYLFFVFASKSLVNFTLTCINASSLKIARVAGVLGIFGKKSFLYLVLANKPKKDLLLSLV